MSNKSQAPFDDKMQAIADSMGISLYARFDLTQASLFLRCSKDDVKQLVKDQKLDCIQVTSRAMDFFGYQLLEHLLASVTNNVSKGSVSALSESSRLIRISEVEHMVGFSRTTIWRKENEGNFPKRVSLGGNRVAWKLNEINNWINSK